MLSHQPEVSRLLHQEYVARLAEDAQRHSQVERADAATPRVTAGRLAHAALDVIASALAHTP